MCSKTSTEVIREEEKEMEEKKMEERQSYIGRTN
jgi:hypothetical protein